MVHSRFRVIKDEGLLVVVDVIRWLQIDARMNEGMLVVVDVI